MSKINENFNAVISKSEETFSKFGFKLLKSDKGERVFEQDGAQVARFVGDKGVFKITLLDEKVETYIGDDKDLPDEAPTKLTTSLFAENADERDVKYVCLEIGEVLNEKFGVKSVAKSRTNQNKTVSKNAVQRGSYYDANTLASKLCLVYPELRDEYKAHLDNYDEFLGEEFFENYGAQKVIDTIKENNTEQMKKLFKLLNEIYDDGTNDTQSLIAVTILGKLENDVALLAVCVDYMSETMAQAVIAVNKCLYSSSGKKYQKLLKNPPPYKPKKVKKPGMFAQAMAQNGGAPMPPM